MRMQAMVECGWAWNVLGKEGLGALKEGFGYGGYNDHPGEEDAYGGKSESQV